MNCDCEGKSDKKFSILRGKENLLNLIRGISNQDEDQQDDEIVKTETISEQPDIPTELFEQETKTQDTQNIEDDIQLKRLQFILDNIERLRYNADNPQKLELVKKDV